MYWNEITWLHENLPKPLLYLWGSSQSLVSWTRRMAFGGDEYLRWNKLLYEMENWPQQKLYEFQYDLLKKLMVHVNQNVPYYRRLFRREKVGPKTIKCIEDLEKLPILTKKDVSANYKRLYAGNVSSRGSIYRSTSGTSGFSLKFCLDKKTYAAILGAHKYYRLMMGYDIDKEKVLRIPIINSPLFFKHEKSSIREGSYSPVIKQVVYSWKKMDDEIFKRYVHQIRKYNITRIEGFPSVVYPFSKYLEKNKIKLAIKSVFLSSEMIYDFHIEHIEKNIAEVYKMYGSAESCVLACDCEKKNGLHINPHGIGEIMNKKPNGSGELIMTNLLNYTFPLLRYNIRDNVEIKYNRCSCGRILPRMTKIEGRDNDFVYLPDGEIIHHYSFANIPKSVPEIEDILIHQHDDYSITCMVVKKTSSNKALIMGEVKKRITRLTKGRLKIDVEFADTIDRKNRKYSVVVSDIGKKK